MEPNDEGTEGNVEEALFIAFMDDPNGKSGGTAMMSKVFEMKKKFKMGFHSFHALGCQRCQTAHLCSGSLTLDGS